MYLQCPKCQSSQIGSINQGRKVAASIGSVAGGAEGAIKAMQTIRQLVPANAPISTMILAGCVGAVAGGIIGSKLGEFVDDNILDNYQCLRCGYTFSKTRE